MSVHLTNVWLHRSDRPVLRAIDWTVLSGQRWVVLGANGAGKTQLLKLLAGAVWPTPRPRTSRVYDWQGARHEEPRDVADEIAYVGAERQDRYEHYDWNLRVTATVGTGLYRTDLPLNPLTAADRRRIEGWLRRLDLLALAGRRLLTLSYGQRRLVLLARALAWKPALLLLDEPLNGLDPKRRAGLLALIERRDAMPRSWVLATHRREDVPASATHLLQLERGRVVWQGALTQTQRRRLPATDGAAIAMSVPPHPLKLPGARTRRAEAARPAAGDLTPLLRLRNAWVWLDGRAALRRLTFAIAPGHCWVVHGSNGSGKSTLIRALYGDLGVAAQGSIRRRGIEAGVAISEFKRRVGLVAPELQTAHPLYLTALDVVVSGLHASIGLDAKPTAAERRRAGATLRSLGAAALAARPLRELSYGQLRRVLFARALVGNPELLLLDEPYTGLDAVTRRALRARIEALSAAGVTVLLTTHHRDEWPSAVTHELELDQGRALYCGEVRVEQRGRAMSGAAIVRQREMR
jgi:molybdate transport system ATP-binding protein